MAHEGLELEGVTIEEARKGVPAGYRISSEEVLCDGAPKTVTSEAATTEDALRMAREQVPAGVEVLEENVDDSSKRSIRVAAKNVHEAETQARIRLSPHESIGVATLFTKGEAGLLGLWHKPNKYDIEIIRKAHAEICFRPRARIRVVLREIPSSLAGIFAYAEELCHSVVKMGEGVRDEANSLHSIGALQVLMFLFDWLEKDVAKQFNEMLADTRRVLAGDPSVEAIDRMSFDFPNQFSVEDIPRCIDLFWLRHRDALAAIEAFKSLLLERARGGIEPLPESKATHVTETASQVHIKEGKLKWSIGLETLGGVFTEVIAAGEQLPCDHNEVFSTASDNQADIKVHVLQGRSQKANENRSLGRYRLKGLPIARRGVPQIQVTFRVSSFGQFTLTARDLTTHSEVSIVRDG